MVVSAWPAEETATTVRKLYARQRQTDRQADRQRALSWNQKPKLIHTCYGCLNSCPHENHKARRWLTDWLTGRSVYDSRKLQACPCNEIIIYYYLQTYCDVYVGPKLPKSALVFTSNSTLGRACLPLRRLWNIHSNCQHREALHLIRPAREF